RRLEGLPAQLGNLEVHFTGAGLQRSLVAASPSVLAGLTALVTACAAKLVGLGIQHGVQRVFHRVTNQLAKMVPDTGFIDLDHLTHRLLVTHRLLLHSMKKPSIPKVRKILYVIRSTRASISLRDVPKSIGLVSSASATYRPWSELGHKLDKLVELDGGKGCKAVGDPVWKQ